MSLVTLRTEGRLGAILFGSKMPHPDLIAPSAQSEGHVSEAAQRLADRIYDPISDKSGQQSVKTLLQVAAVAQGLQRRKSGRYVHRKAAGKVSVRRKKIGR
jgi:hypothetical protein